MSSALQSMGTPMEEGTVEMLLAKASYDVMLYQASYASTEEEVAFLQQEYAAEMSEDEQDRIGARIKALEQLLVEQGVGLETLRRAVGAEQTPAPGPGPLPGPARVPGPAVRRPEAYSIYSDDGKTTTALEQLEERLRRTEAQLAVRDAAAPGIGSVGSATPGPDALAAVMENKLSSWRRH